MHLTKCIFYYRIVKDSQSEENMNLSDIIEEYIKNQLQDDIAYDQLSLKEFIDPFTGEPVMKGK